MKSALKSNKENLEVIENELKTLLVDLAAIYDVSPNNIEVLSAKISDMNNPNYNKDTHIKFQFLMAMKQTMEIGNLIQVDAKPEQKVGEFIAEPRNYLNSVKLTPKEIIKF